MLYLCRNIAVLLPCIFFHASAAQALEDGVQGIGHVPSWRVENAVIRRSSAPVRTYSLDRTQTWASGIATTSRSAFTRSHAGKTLGAKMQPFHDWNFLVGTELTRSGGDSRSLASRAMWESFWTQDLNAMGGLKVGLSTTGSLDHSQTDYLQSFSGSLNVPLDIALNAWNVELRVSPSMNVDVSNGSLYSSISSEIMGRKVLSSRHDAFKSTVNISVGYSLAPDTRPSASARLELLVSPNL